MSADHAIAQLRAALDVTRSGYHTWQQAAPSARETADAALSQSLAALHAEHRGRYGAPRLMRALRQRGQCPCRYVPRTTDSAHDHRVAPNRLAAAPKPTAPNQIWASNLTYVPTAEGWRFVAVILDLWSRKVVGWASGATLAAATVLAALQMGLRQRQPPRGLLHHSDRGVQYACAAHRAVLAAAGLEASMSRPGNPYDNAAMESFMATYKRECVGLAQAAGGYAKRADAATDFFAYAEIYYNRVRLHFKDYDFGIYWDSFAHPQQMKSHGAGIEKISPRWRTAPIGGVVAYDWGNFKAQLDDNPDDIVSDPIHRRFLMDSICRLHANHLGWVASYDPGKPLAREGAEEVQRAFGYRWVIDEASYPAQIVPQQPFAVSVSVRNLVLHRFIQGSSPTPSGCL